MKELLETIVGQGVLGQVVKHVLPWDGLNKFIPAINIVGGVAYNKAQGMDWGSAVTIGVVGALGAKAGKDIVRERMNGKQFPGLGIQDGKMVVVKRSF